MRSHLATAAAVLLLAGLSACTDDPEPQVAPPPDSPSTPTSTAPPSSDPPETTPPVEDETAEEFIRRWQAAAVQMQMSGDTSGYRTLTFRCESCESLADSVDQIYATGGRVKTGQPTIRDLKRVGGHDGVLIFEYTLVSPPTTILKEDGTVETRYPGGEERYQLNVMMRSARWKVLRVSQLVA